ncbi:MAG: HU family DNA-binding protein [Fibrobacterota bacterium]
MNKAELIQAVTKEVSKEREVSKALVETVVNSTLGTIKKNTKKGVQLIGFGTFTVSKRKARTGRNPQTGEQIKIKASKTVKFKPGKAYKDAL